MKYLSQFIKFDWIAFAQAKQFLVTGCSAWKDHNSDNILGTRVEVAIVKDATPYQHKDGETGSNRFEKLTFKVSKQVSISEGAYVVPVDATAKVYGDYRNQLSITCNDVKIVQVRQS